MSPPSQTTLAPTYPDFLIASSHSPPSLAITSLKKSRKVRFSITTPQSAAAAGYSEIRDYRYPVPPSTPTTPAMATSHTTVHRSRSKLNLLFPINMNALGTTSDSATSRLLALVFYASSSAPVLRDDDDDDHYHGKTDHRNGDDDEIDGNNNRSSTENANSFRIESYTSLLSCLVDLFVTSALSAGLCMLLLINLTVLMPLGDGWRILRAVTDNMGPKSWTVVMVWLTVLCLRFRWVWWG